MFVVFNLAIFTSAFLLFLIQPMVANMLLAKVGGSPNIWNACTVFFQISLLAGYSYSYFVSQKLPLKRQIVLHCLLLFCALWAVRFHFQTDIIAVDRPITDTLLSLLKNIFLPFVLLSTTSPLIQRWLSLSELEQRKNPYLLYVFSNIGSLLALYAYPLLLEKKLTLTAQGNAWHILFGLFFCIVAVIGMYLNKTASRQSIEIKVKTNEKNSFILIFYWILFAFIPSSLMLGVTNYLSTDIGGLPFLWILPLSLYLLSFVLTFSKFYTKDIESLFFLLYKTAALCVVFLFYKSAISNNSQNNLSLICLHCLFYFIFSTYCHGILSNKKPAADKLTLFYLCLAIGGALGGVFNTFVAPHLFLSFAEYPFIIGLSLPFVISNLSESQDTFKKILKNILVVLFILIALNYINKFGFGKDIKNVFTFLSLVFGLFFIFSKKRSFLFLCLFGSLFLSMHLRSDTNIVFKKRNFFGTVIVKKISSSSDSSAALALLHGDTGHGRQNGSIVNGEFVYSYNPDAYYGSHSAVKEAFNVFKRPYDPRIAWLGLGSGATICYAQPETHHDVFEIDRDIVEVSTKYRYFRYLEHCAPQADIKIGDARIEITKEEAHKYDLIAIDVFSSHFIPVHLTTKEALETYRSKLKEDGLILFHISSRAFDVEPILAKIAQELNMAFIVRFLPPYDRNCTNCNFPQWGVLANSYDNQEIKTLLSMPGWRKAKMGKDTPLWTDDFHNLLSALRHENLIVISSPTSDLNIPVDVHTLNQPE